MQPPNAGLYIHIPFCLKKCAYCDFYSVADLSLGEAFLDAVIHEMQLLGSLPLAFDTIYLGGGTPSVLPPRSIESLIAKTVSQFDIHSNAEITIEVNPGTIDRECLIAYQRAGINRINIGVQSFSDTALDFLGRIHTSVEAETAIVQARQVGFDNLGLDLIFGLPDQNMQGWQQDLEKAVGFTPEHLSCYTLTYEKGTPLEKRIARGRVCPLDDDRVADLFKTTQNVLAQNSYEHYEIANYARLDRGCRSINTEKSYRSRHNQKYWTGAPYIGLGPSAHSFVEPERRWNVADIHTYLARLEQGVLPIQSSEALTDEQRLTETLYLELRTLEGINIPRLEEKYHLDFHARYGNTVNDLLQQELLELTETRCVLTRKGMRFLDGIAAMLLGQ